MRVFIAVELVQDLRRQLALLQESLKECQADVKWVEEENLHLTLHFLGEIEQGEILRVRAAMQKAGQEMSPFALSLAGTGLFPGPARPRVVWAGLSKGIELLTQLRRYLGEYLEEIGINLDQKPFSPHITLGRVRSPVNADRLVAKLRAYAKEPLGSQKVKGLSLFESRLARQGPQYYRLAWVPLSGIELRETLTESGRANIMDLSNKCFGEERK